jgi:hypothetical protein
MRPAEALRAALAILEAEQLAAHVLLIRQMRGLAVRSAVDRDAFTILGGAERLEVRRHGLRRFDARVRVDRAAIFDLLDGRSTILEEVQRRRLDLVADPEVLLRLARAQRAFAEGAAHSRRMTALLEAFRGAPPPVRQKRRLAM